MSDPLIEQKLQTNSNNHLTLYRYCPKITRKARQYNFYSIWSNNVRHKTNTGIPETEDTALIQSTVRPLRPSCPTQHCRTTFADYE